MFAYIHIHKTAGSTIHSILKSSFGTRYALALPWQAPFHWTELFSPSDLRRLLKIYPELVGLGSHNVRAYNGLDEVVPNIQYVTFIRDPLKMRISMYQHGRRPQIALRDAIKNPVKMGLHRYEYGVAKTERRTFEEWCQDEQSHNRLTKMIAGAADVNEASRLINEKNIFVGITELFDESLIVLKSLFFPTLDISYRRVNVAPDKTLSHDLLSNPRTVQMAEEGITADTELYEYIKNDVFPKYQREYGTSLSVAVEKFQQSNKGFNRRNLLVWEAKHKFIYRVIMTIYRKNRRFV